MAPRSVRTSLTAAVVAAVAVATAAPVVAAEERTVADLLPGAAGSVAPAGELPGGELPGGELSAGELAPGEPPAERDDASAAAGAAPQRSAGGATAMSATGMSATGTSATGTSATGMSATGTSATGTSATGTSAGTGWPLAARVAATPRPAGDLRVEGSGFGHSVGLSQHGARAQAAAGRDAATILTSYYPGTTVATRAHLGEVRVGLASGVASVPITLREGRATWRCVTGCDWSETHTTVGSTWSVRPRPGGGFVVRRPDGSEQQVPGTAGAVLAVDHDGQGRVQGPNPVATPATYRHGRLELSVAGSTLTAVQVVPDLDRYLRGLAEMPSSWPAAALEAQAIVGRTFALRALARPPRTDCRCHLRASPADQAYTGWNKEGEAGFGTRWVAAVEATSGRVVTHGDELAETYYSSSHGGRTEHVEDSWAFGTAAVPYLRSVDDPWSLDPAAGNPRAAWTATVPLSAVRSLLPVPLERITRVTVLERTEGGTPRTLQLTGEDAAGARRVVTWPDGGKPAGARLRTRVGGALLPSQQLASVGIGPFRDAHGHALEEGIAFADAAGITTGVTPTSFAPGRAVTRGQMASFLDRTFALPAGEPGRFTDVTGGVHAAAIEAIAAAGITQGCTATSFCPDAPVTRDQMASFLARALGLPERTPGSFADVPSGSVHARNIEAIAHAGITTGCTEGRYCPAAPVSRAQMATFLYRAAIAP
jgi:SpoIID/LytB domain protein